MPTPVKIAAKVTIDAEPETVWRAAVDWPRQHEWIWGTRVDGGHGTGAGVTGRTGLGPVGFTDPMVITDWDPRVITPAAEWGLRSSLRRFARLFPALTPQD